MHTKRLVTDGILTAVALTIFVLEAQLPLPVPIPGIKLGLSNIVTLFALVFLSGKDAAGILLARILLGAFLTGNPATLLYSLLGGLSCLAAEVLLLRLGSVQFIWGISAIGALVHNTAQLAAAALVTRTASVFWYLPFLWIAGILTGLFTGLCIWYLAAHCQNQIRRFLPKK